MFHFVRESVLPVSSTSSSNSTALATVSPSKSIEWHNCTIEAEGPGNNPDYCLAFYDLTAETESSRTLDCCWTANEHSVLSARLRDVVTVHWNGTMYNEEFQYLSQNFKFFLYFLPKFKPKVQNEHRSVPACSVV